ncbi:hypothetical protein DVA67_017065 [Solirubrobacter sp. CPCC 204708]|uniref:Uncharacterized protein n=1 Tax=Solirubrobacter deserti TaxID=2282478 RepID=A0ABT4RJD7_9ACTN|nr:hypothetical protein [Solirubrobacter deserti]MBE2317695.1 hypothetical protein [Solirubrobacter deserti]MDA0138646.1 hypothetical protein [Solirubrobacter deserti]
MTALFASVGETLQGIAALAIVFVPLCLWWWYDAKRGGDRSGGGWFSADGDGGGGD